MPKYTADTSIFICPGGRDAQIPSGEPLRKHKISYAYYMGRRLDTPQALLMSDRQVDTQPKRAGEFVFSPDGKPPGNNHHKYGGNFLIVRRQRAGQPGATEVFAARHTRRRAIESQTLGAHENPMFLRREIRL